MKPLILLFALCGTLTVSASEPYPSTADFADCINHWQMVRGREYTAYRPDEYRAIAANIVAWQNPDGGWPKNVDLTARMPVDSLRQTIDARHLKSTIDNTNVYPQISYLSEVFRLTGDSLYIRSAARGVEYILAAQYPNGGWRGWDADCITFNDNIMAGILSFWLDVVQGNPLYGWMDAGLRARVEQSFDRGLDLTLRCQYVQQGVKTVWPQQSDHHTLAPCKARAYELPALSAGESVGVVLLLMRIKHPSPQVIEAVKAAVVWFERSAIRGKKTQLIAVPEGLAEDRAIKRDRVLVDDPTGVIWARYYEPETNRPFFATRAGLKVYTMAEVPAERRVGYGWYGTWGAKVLKAYPKWLARIEKEAQQ